MLSAAEHRTQYFLIVSPVSYPLDCGERAAESPEELGGKYALVSSLLEVEHW